MKLESEIEPGNRVYVRATNKYGQDVSYYATVIEWTKSGLLKVESDLVSTSGRQIKCVSAICVKLLR
ncbi:hypothetical protein [Fibrella forsythiae]|uniref:Uncharacterized protein n=1 Tax=Fibrella forsythiae TaxID=2817061 RepID=A0ABS3JVI5_9BACT|nr:hypothetical protein [Fibrella forsythiae]MBO0953189.1 hypothetical protein [Fibrella forsythiae]